MLCPSCGSKGSLDGDVFTCSASCGALTRDPQSGEWSPAGDRAPAAPADEPKPEPTKRADPVVVEDHRDPEPVDETDGGLYRKVTLFGGK